MIEKLLAAISVVASAFAAFIFLDARHASSEALTEFRWTQEKRAISETQDEIGFAENQGDIERLARKEEELDQIIDVFCHQFPDDRECD